MGKVEEIISFLKENRNDEDKLQVIKRIKVHEDVYGVKLAKINPMISTWAKNITFDDVIALWEDGKTESRIIAAKLLGRLGRKDPDKTLNLIKTFSKDLKDWATTDTLATQGVRGIIKEKEGDIKELAITCLKSKNIFTKRFGVVIFINFPDDEKAKEIVEVYLKDKEYYIKKAAEWLMRKSSRK